MLRRLGQDLRGRPGLFAALDPVLAMIRERIVRRRRAASREVVRIAGRVDLPLVEIDRERSCALPAVEDIAGVKNFALDPHRCRRAGCPALPVDEATDGQAGRLVQLPDYILLPRSATPREGVRRGVEKHRRADLHQRLTNCSKPRKPRRRCRDCRRDRIGMDRARRRDRRRGGE